VLIESTPMPDAKMGAGGVYSTQDDHLECEEEFVLPEIRQRVDEETQTAMVGKLLVDDTAEDSTWVFDWVPSVFRPRSANSCPKPAPKPQAGCSG